MSDRQAKARIVTRINRLALGNPGDVKIIGPGLSELRLHFGPGYRVYFTVRDHVAIVLLAGGDKSTQRSDVRRAIELMDDL